MSYHLKLNNLYSKETFWLLYIPIGLFILNFILKFIYLDESSISNDEPFSIYHAQMDIPSIINQLCLGNNPPFFEIILHYWIKLFGISALSVRFLPMIFSVLTSLVIYKIGIRHFTKSVALFAALLFTFSTTQYVFVHQARVYTLFVLLSCLSIYSFLNIYKTNKKVLAAFYLSLCNIILIYSHYFGIWIPVVEACAILILPSLRKTILKPVIYSFTATIICYIPIITIFLRQFSTSASKGTWVQPIDVGASFVQYYHFFNGQIVAILSLVSIVTYIILTIYRKQPANVYSQVIALWFVLPFLTMFLLSLKYSPHPIPMFIERYILFTSPALFILTVKAIDYCINSLIIKYISMSLIVIFVVKKSNIHLAEIWPTKEEAEFIHQIKTPETIVYYAPVWYTLNFAYHYDKKIFANYNTVDIYKNIIENLKKQQIYSVYNYNTLDTTLVFRARKFVCIDADGQWSSTENESLRKKTLTHFSKEEVKTIQNGGSHTIYIYEK